MAEKTCFVVISISKWVPLINERANLFAGTYKAALALLPPEIISGVLASSIKTESTSSIIAKLFYGKYPKLVEAINNRYKMYNETLDLVNKLEKQKEIFVFRPSTDLKISRVEKNPDKLQAMYDLGINDFNNNLSKLKKFLKK